MPLVKVLQCGLCAYLKVSGILKLFAELKPICLGALLPQDPNLHGSKGKSCVLCVAGACNRTSLSGFWVVWAIETNLAEGLQALVQVGWKWPRPSRRGAGRRLEGAAESRAELQYKMQDLVVGLIHWLQAPCFLPPHPPVPKP